MHDSHDQASAVKADACNVFTPRLNPINVDEVTPEQFDVLLGILYPQCVMIKAYYSSQPDFTLHSCLAFKLDMAPRDWVMVVSIASKLGIKPLREAALAKVQKLCSAIELVELGKKFDIFECFSAGFRMLCMREDTLTLAEGELLGMATVIEIARAREMLGKGTSWNQIGLKDIS